MHARGENRHNYVGRSALADVGRIAAAVAGVGFASGRETAAFFGQLGWAAWVGIPFAALLFALLVGAIGHYARVTGARSFAGIYRRLLNNRLGDAVGLLHALLLALTAAVMLESAGELGALALPLRHGWLWGIATALMLALLMNLAGLRALPALGLFVSGASLAFYAAMAMDARPVRVYLRSETAMALSGNVGAAILLAALYAALNACLAGGMIARANRGTSGSGGLAAACGGGMCALLMCANAALCRGGAAILGQAMPSVILAARWGIAGFWVSVGLQYGCAVATLTAAIGSLVAQMNDGAQLRRQAMTMLAAAAILIVGLGLSRTLGRVYAAFGWAGALCAALLAFRYDRRVIRRGRV